MISMPIKVICPWCAMPLGLVGRQGTSYKVECSNHCGFYTTWTAKEIAELEGGTKGKDKI